MARLSKLDKKMRDYDIWQLRAKGHSVQEIADLTGYSPSQVRSSLSRVAEEYKVEAAAEIIKMELDRLDIMLQHAMQILEERYVAYSHGKMMLDDAGNPVMDPAPVLKAIDSVIKIMDRRSKYLGLDAPTRSEQSINVHKDPSAADLAVLSMISDFKQAALDLTPEQLAAAQTPAALPQTPEHPTITLPSDHFAPSAPHPTTDPTTHPYHETKEFARAVEESDRYDDRR